MNFNMDEPRSSRGSTNKIVLGSLAVLIVLGGMVYLAKQAPQVLPPSSQENQDAPLVSRDSENGQDPLKITYSKLFQALSDDNIHQACELCDHLVPTLSRDNREALSSLEQEILLLCGSAEKQKSAAQREALERQIGTLPQNALEQRLEGFYKLIEMDGTNRSYPKMAQALEGEILEKTRRRVEEAFGKGNAAKACALCDGLPTFRFVSPESLAPLCEKAKEEKRQKDIEAILREVKPLPASDYKGNLRGYRRLLQLAPEETVYWDKIERYTKSAARAQRRLLRKWNARMEYDIAQGVFWYFPTLAAKRSSSEGAHLYLYIGEKDDGAKAKLRLVCLTAMEHPKTEDKTPLPQKLVLSFGKEQYPLTLSPQGLHQDKERGLWWCDLELAPSSELFKAVRKASRASSVSFAFMFPLSQTPGEKAPMGWSASKEEIRGLGDMLGLFEKLQ